MKTITMSRPTYLGMTIPTAIGVGLAAAAVGVAIGLAAPTPLDRAAPCGLTVEEGVVLPAACSTADELAERLDRIRVERSVGVERDRPTDAARCAAMNGLPLTRARCATYLSEVDAVAASCGTMVHEAWERCADDVLAAHRAAVGR